MRAQGLESKLGQQTDYLPRAAAPVDQLVEVAQRFNIPMGIEWLEGVEDSPGRDSVPGPAGRRRTVAELIGAILEQSPGHRFAVEGGLLRVFPPAVVAHPSNFLNIRVGRFRVEDVDLFEAEDRLRTAINFALHPGLFKNGFGGGYGHPPDHVFVIPNVTVSGEELSVRDVLSGIAASSGNALWVVRLRPEEFASRRPYWEGKPIDEYGHSPVNTRWHFLPLAEVAELAPEQIVVELTVEGFPRTERVVIPLLAEYGLSADGRGRVSVFGGGRSYSYAVGVDKIGRDAVILKFDFSTRPPNGAEISTEETITVLRGSPVERPLPGGGRLRAFVEARGDGTHPTASQRARAATPTRGRRVHRV